MIQTIPLPVVSVAKIKLSEYEIIIICKTEITFYYNAVMPETRVQIFRWLRIYYCCHLRTLCWDLFAQLETIVY